MCASRVSGRIGCEALARGSMPFGVELDVASDARCWRLLKAFQNGHQWASANRLS
jgi:hypothetical protein